MYSLGDHLPNPVDVALQGGSSAGNAGLSTPVAHFMQKGKWWAIIMDDLVR